MRLLGGGSSKPGEIALKFSPRILGKLARRYNVILVTGTNGKTTTCSMIYNIYRRAGLKVINNSSGANMPGGIVTCLAAAHKFFARSDEKYAVIEVDEAYAKVVTAQIKPKAFVVTNIFQDQVDRYGDVQVTKNYIVDAVKNTPDSVLFINADQPILRDLPVSNQKIWFGGNVSNGETSDLPAVPITIDFAVGEDAELSLKSSVVTVNGRSLSVGVPGFYNVYNALCAYSVCSFFGISHETIASSLSEQVSKFGRFEVIQIEESELVMLLIKNPAGANQCIDTVALDDGNISLLIMLNDNAGDGRDISWIDDTNFEKLAEMDYSNVIAGGTRADDLAERLRLAGLENVNVFREFDEILTAVKGEKRRVYALVSYTAMFSFRKYLAGKDFVARI